MALDDYGWKWERPGARYTPEQKREARLKRNEQRRTTRKQKASENPGITCLSCGSIRLDCINTRPYLNTIRRQKDCRACGYRTYTVEVYEADIPETARLVEAIKSTVEALDNARWQLIEQAKVLRNDSESE